MTDEAEEVEKEEEENDDIDVQSMKNSRTMILLGTGKLVMDND